MRSGRLLLIIGGVLLVVAIVVGVLTVVRPWSWLSRLNLGRQEGTPAPEAQALVEVVVAAQNIPRGMQLAEGDNAVALQDWPADAVPSGAITDLAGVYGRIARVDIALGMPLLENMLAETRTDLAAGGGSDAALQIPEGMVGYAVPVARYSSVAWAVQPGDRVDVLLSLAMVDLDEELQTQLPNSFGCVSPTSDEGCEPGTLGRLEVLPNAWVVNVIPAEGESQSPRLVTQATVQDAIVLRVGDWPAVDSGRAGAAAERAPATAEGGEELAPIEKPTDRIEPMTIAVSRQDAMILDYALAAGARINFLLRSTGDTDVARTEAVTLEYLLDRYSIEVPPKLPYGVTPPIAELERMARDHAGSRFRSSSVEPSAQAEE
jgi:pilus assembly protein CpaB